MNYAGSALLVLLVVFNALVRYVGLEWSIYAVTGALILLSAGRVLLRPKIRAQAGWLLPLILCGGIAAVWTSATLSTVIAAAGIVGAFAYLLLWATQLATGGFGDDARFVAWHVRMHVVCGFLTAALSVYQYFFNPDLWGVLPPRPFTDAAMIGAGFTKRATGLIGSPQNLGIYMGLAGACVLLSQLRPWLKMAYGVLILVAGLLSGSAAFIAFLLLMPVGYFWSARRVHVTVLRAFLVVPLLLGVIVAQKADDIQDNIFSAFYMGDPLADRLPLFLDLVDYDSPYTLVFGHGLGTANRVTEVLIGEGRTPREWRPSESYVGTVAHEMGLAGLAALAILFAVAIYRASRLDGRVGRVHLGILLGMLGNWFATPSFTGLTMAAIAWPFILYPLLARLPPRERLETAAFPRTAEA